jgi:hypothetical protein
MLERMNDDIEEQITETLRGVLGDRVTRENLRDFVDMSQVDPPPGTDRGSEATISMLEGVQGFANLVLVKNWRIGRCAESYQMFTSDEAVAAYLTPVRPFWSGGAFWEFQFFFPISPSVLLWIPGDDYKREVDPTKLPPPFGPRKHHDFNEWETSFARHVVSESATRYVFGRAANITRNAARQYIERFDQLQMDVARVYQGFDPRQPRNPAIENLLRKR